MRDVISARADIGAKPKSIIIGSIFFMLLDIFTYNYIGSLNPPKEVRDIPFQVFFRCD